MKRYGFTLLELMVVVAIIAFLSMISIPSIMGIFSKAKRTESYMNLKSLYMAEKSYFADNGVYTDDLELLGWEPGSGHLYTYGFPGSEEKNYKAGSLKTPPTTLSLGFVNEKGFVAVAAADIDGDAAFDIVTIDQDGTIKVVQDDLL